MLVGHRAAPEADATALLAVHVALVWAEAVPGKMLEALGKVQLEAEARQRRQVPQQRLDGRLDHHVAAAVDGVSIGAAEGRRHAVASEHCLDAHPRCPAADALGLDGGDAVDDAVVAGGDPLVAEVLVVVGRGTPELDLRPAGQQREALPFPVGHHRPLAVERDGEAVAADQDRAVVVRDRDLRHVGHADRSRRGGRDGDLELREGDLVAARRPEGVRLLREAEVQPDARARRQRRQLDGDRDLHRLAGRDRQLGQRALTDDAIVGEEGPRALEILQRREVAAADDAEPALGEVNGLDVDGLDDGLVLDEAGVGDAVGEAKAVAAEVAVVGLVAEVAAVGEPLGARLRPHADSVVGPLPDAAAAQPRVLADGLPVLLEVARPLAHGVGVFAHEEGAGVVGHPALLGEVVDVRVHLALDVVELEGDVPGVLLCSGACGALVVYEAGGVGLADPACHGVVVGAVARFVA